MSDIYSPFGMNRSSSSIKSYLKAFAAIGTTAAFVFGLPYLVTKAQKYSLVNTSQAEILQSANLETLADCAGNQTVYQPNSIHKNFASQAVPMSLKMGPTICDERIHAHINIDHNSKNIMLYPGTKFSDPNDSYWFGIIRKFPNSNQYQVISEHWAANGQQITLSFGNESNYFAFLSDTKTNDHRPDGDLERAVTLVGIKYDPSCGNILNSFARTRTWCADADTTCIPKKLTTEQHSMEAKTAPPIPAEPDAYGFSLWPQQKAQHYSKTK